MSARIVGLSRVLGRINALSAKLPEAAGEALHREMVDVMFESQKVVPYDEGDLHDSGEVDRPEVSGGTVTVRLHYGGGNVDYALEQHERLDYVHPQGGSAKFLETPLHAWGDGGPERVVRRALGGRR